MPCFTRHVLLACILLQIHPLLLAVQHNSLLVPCCPVVRLCCAPFWPLTPSKTKRTKTEHIPTMAPTAGLLYKCKAISRILKTMASCNSQPFEFSAVVAKCFSQPTGKGQFSQADQHIGTAAPGNCGKRYTDRTILSLQSYLWKRNLLLTFGYKSPKIVRFLTVTPMFCRNFL